MIGTEVVMRLIDEKEFLQKAEATIRETLISMAPWAYNKLEGMIDDTPSGFAAQILRENARIARLEERPLCQDTGYATFFIRFGREIKPFDIDRLLTIATKNAYSNGARLSVADPISRENTRTNTPICTHLEFVEGNKLTVHFLPRGFGAENMTKLYMLNPTVGKEGIIEAVLNAVHLAGSKPCPPVLLGIGIGGVAESALLEAKKQLIREEDNQDIELKELEKLIFERLKETNIGVQGFKGENYAYAVRIGKLPTHIAGLPVAVCFGCNAIREGKFVL